MSISDRGTAVIIINTIAATGIKAPAALAESWQRTQRVSEKVHALGVRDSALYTPIYEAIMDDRDPAADPEVQRILTSGRISNGVVMAGVEAMAYAAFRDTCTEHADAIVSAWAKPFEAAAKTLDNAHQRIGDVPLEDSATILQKGGDIAQVWAQAQAAVHAVNTISGGWMALGEFTNRAANDQRYPVLRIASVDYKMWQDQHLTGGRAGGRKITITPWEAVLAGLTLSLPTFTEYAQRVDTIQQGAEQAAAQLEDDGRAYMTGRRPGWHKVTVL